MGESGNPAKRALGKKVKATKDLRDAMQRAEEAEARHQMQVANQVGVINRQKDVILGLQREVRGAAIIIDAFLERFDPGGDTGIILTRRELETAESTFDKVLTEEDPSTNNVRIYKRS